ncbi:MAG: hypothetical protein HRT51_09300 [Colwellia sp.]|nr:hypothetical protein [Colwellia sp.]
MKTIFISSIAMLFIIFYCWQKGLFAYSYVVHSPTELNEKIENTTELTKDIANEKSIANESATLANQCQQEIQFEEIDAPEVEVIETNIEQVTSSQAEAPHSQEVIEPPKGIQKQIELANKSYPPVSMTSNQDKPSVETEHLDNQQPKTNTVTPIVSIDTGNIKSLFQWINQHNKVALYCDGSSNTLYRYVASKWTVALQISEQGALREFGSKMKNAASLPNNCSRLLIVWPAHIWSNITSPLNANDSLEFAEIELSISNQKLYAEVITSKPSLPKKRYKVASL